MTTLIPPPSKRQRTELSERAREQQGIEEIPKNSGSLRIQFFDETTGLPIGGPTQVPVVDASPRNLELLVNSLQKNASLINGISFVIYYSRTDLHRIHQITFHIASIFQLRTKIGLAAKIP